MFTKARDDTRLGPVFPYLCAIALDVDAGLYYIRGWVVRNYCCIAGILFVLSGMGGMAFADATDPDESGDGMAKALESQNSPPMSFDTKPPADVVGESSLEKKEFMLNPEENFYGDTDMGSSGGSAIGGFQDDDY